MSPTFAGSRRWSDWQVELSYHGRASQSVITVSYSTINGGQLECELFESTEGIPCSNFELPTIEAVYSSNIAICIVGKQPDCRRHALHRTDTDHTKRSEQPRRPGHRRWLVALCYFLPADSF